MRKLISLKWLGREGSVTEAETEVDLESTHLGVGVECEGECALLQFEIGEEESHSLNLAPCLVHLIFAYTNWL